MDLIGGRELLGRYGEWVRQFGKTRKKDGFVVVDKDMKEVVVWENLRRELDQDDQETFDEVSKVDEECDMRRGSGGGCMMRFWRRGFR